MWRCLGRGGRCGGEARARALSLDRARGLSGSPSSVAPRYHHSADGHELADDYEVGGEVLGDGCCGEVVAATARGSGRSCAVKRLDKRRVPFWRVRALVSEAEIHLALDHPGIAWLCDVYETEDDISLVMERCEGGELYTELQRRGSFPSASAAQCALQLLHTVAHMHSRGIVHRDLKLENVLYSEKDRNPTSLKLIDFGFAEVWDPGKPAMSASCGSAAYVSPDVMAGDGYTHKCDVWSAGVIVFMLLAGYPPFHGSEEQMLEKVRVGQPDWSFKGRWKHVPADAVDLVERLLTKDPASRPEAREALRHAWLQRAAAEPRPPPAARRALLSLGRYAGASPLRRAALRLMALEAAPGAAADLRGAFHALDLAGEGALCPRQLRRALLGEEAPARRLLPDLSAGERAALCDALGAAGGGPVHFSEFVAASLDVAPALEEGLLLSAFGRLGSVGPGAVGLSWGAAGADPGSGLDFAAFARAVQAGAPPCAPAPSAAAPGAAEAETTAAAASAATSAEASGSGAAAAERLAAEAPAASAAAAERLAAKAPTSPRSPRAGARGAAGARRLADIPTPSRRRAQARPGAGQALAGGAG